MDMTSIGLIVGQYGGIIEVNPLLESLPNTPTNPTLPHSFEL